MCLTVFLSVSLALIASAYIAHDERSSRQGARRGRPHALNARDGELGATSNLANLYVALMRFALSHEHHAYEFGLQTVLCGWKEMRWWVCD